MGHISIKSEFNLTKLAFNLSLLSAAAPSKVDRCDLQMHDVTRRLAAWHPTHPRSFTVNLDPSKWDRQEDSLLVFPLGTCWGSHSLQEIKRRTTWGDERMWAWHGRLRQPQMSSRSGKIDSFTIVGEESGKELYKTLFSGENSLADFSNTSFFFICRSAASLWQNPSGS